MSLSILASFHPLVGEWFRGRFGAPTDVQTRSWTEIIAGNHVLVTAPTGSGKTLAAFLWGLQQLLTGAWPPGGVRLLYVSPLKALNNDVRRNLFGPLTELRDVFFRSGVLVPGISVVTRSGDTPADERRRMLRTPPEVLITTPESLNLLLLSPGSSSLLTGVRTVVLDEIHAVAGTKRGTHLITAVERLTLLCGEFQRVALSATVEPAGRIADFVGGFRREDSGGYERRAVTVVRSSLQKSYELTVTFPSGSGQSDPQTSIWPALIAPFKEIISRHRSTLFFTNSRRTAERVARLINEGEHQEVAYAHHGSLAREIRLAVEKRLKQGALKAIVATNSLELGIDIGTLDQVVLVQTPRSVSSALQRIGRSGHYVGQASRGTFFPTHGRDLVNAAVMARAVLEQDIEEIRPVEAPLDILAQVILSLVSVRSWDRDELYAFLKCCYPYRDLERSHFDAVLSMLNGRYAGTRLRDLKARLSVDALENTVQAHSGVRYLLAVSSGTIPERGYFELRVREGNAKIGELDEEFVWERRAGDTFLLGTQLWRVDRITQSAVEVAPVKSAASLIPFWRAEEQHRDFHLAERIGLFLEHADHALGTDRFVSELQDRCRMEPAAAAALVEFLKLQKAATGASLPHRNHLLVERIEEPGPYGGMVRIVLHSLWGGRVNSPFALALAQAWEEREGTPLTVVADDDGVLVQVPRPVRLADLLDLVSPDNLEHLLRRKLEQSGFFGARFRENAERALLLPKGGFKRRMPLWVMRQRAKELFSAVRSFGDFPILLETWRTCLQDAFDLNNLLTLLDQVHNGGIRTTEIVTRTASPFASRLVWKQTNVSVYEDDTPPPGTAPGLRQDLIREVLFSPRLRPRVPAELIARLDAKLKRTEPGYSPASAPELLDWIRDRLLVPEPEWRDLAAAVRRDHDQDAADWLAAQSRSLCWLSWPGVLHPLLASLEAVPRVLIAFRLLLPDLTLQPAAGAVRETELRRRAEEALRSGPGPDEVYDLSGLLAAWLPFYGPLRLEQAAGLLGATRERLIEALEPLVQQRSVVVDQISEADTGVEVCDTENLEILLRMTRRFRQPSFTPLPIEQLPLFLALYQGLTRQSSSVEEMQQRLEQLFGWPAPVGTWEESVLPARIRAYRSDTLDMLLTTTDLIWFGCGEQRISLAFQQDLELFRPGGEQGETADGELDGLIPARRGHYSFFEIAEHAHLDTVHATERLWKQAWKGNVTTDTFRTVRKGILSGFRAQDLPAADRPLPRRSGFDRWKASRPLEGHWHRIDQQPADHDVIDDEELAKERVRQLFRRYGILFRGLLQNELPPLQWRNIFRSLRLMEFSGEVTSGYFFRGPAGPQFIAPDALRMLREPLPDDAVFWINAADPASLCGAGLVPGLPPRVLSSHLVYHGARLVMVSRRLGRAVEVQVSPGEPRLPDYLALFRDLVQRDFNPLSRVIVETINGGPAVKSPFADAFRKVGFRASHATLELWREY